MKRAVAVMALLLQAATLHGETLYTWKDARGTVFYTNSLHEIPARYLRKARVLDVASGKKGGLAVDQPVVQNPPAPASAPPAQSALAPSVSPSPAPPAADAATYSRPAVPPAATVSTPEPQTTQAPARRRGWRRAHRARGGEE